MIKRNVKVKILCMMLILLAFCMSQSLWAACGDVNATGTVDIVDALLIAQYYVGLNPANFDVTSANVNGDANVDIVDALIVAQYYVGLIATLPGCSSTPAGTTAPTPPPGSIDCTSLPFWSATAAYETTGTKVYYNGNVYQNNWYSTNENPETNSGTGKVWTLVGACDPAYTPAPTATARPIPTQGSGSLGYATRFWDCCKPHCSWTANVPAGMPPLVTCMVDGTSTNPDKEAKSSCEGGNAYVCYKFIPFAANDDLAYGFAATQSGDICGKCYEIQFTGQGKYSNTPGAVALQGKRMIVMAVNIGYDVGGGQFDILTPGGGVGAFNGCSTQWGIANSELGAQYGGLLTLCNQSVGYYDHAAIKTCLRQKNDSLFRAKGLTQMAAGLDWFIDWYEAADNPTIYYWEVACPQVLKDISGMVR
jgi:hypothetical protein